jgi:UDP-2,3-diacylglucosamine hydrolase
LKEIKPHCAELFLVGDVFDFWFEYKHAIPKGFVRLQAAIAYYTDSGIPVHYFTGNHDMWVFDYFENELGVKMHRNSIIREVNGYQMMIGHGDGLGPGDHGYKFIKKIFRNPIAKTAFGILPPVIGIGLANYFSRKSRAKTGNSDEVFESEDKEWLVSYCKDVLKTEHYDYFVFGHRHLPLDIQLNENSQYINLGDWIKYFSYAELEAQQLQLKYYKP